MKHNLHNIKAVRYIGIVLLVLILALVSSGTAAATPPDDPNGNTQESQEAISSYLAAQNNPALSDEEKIKAAINAYFTTRYEGQKSLVMQNFSPLLEDDTLDWVKAEQDKREIELYVATLFDLRYEKYTFTLDYDSIKIKNGEAVVLLRESHTVVFSALAPDESMLSNLPHTITLHYSLVRGIHGISYNPPAPVGIFSDVPTSHWAAKWIEQLYNDGITAGCSPNPLRYCPDSLVTHAQMAIFLLRSYYDSSYTPPFANYQTYFNDVPPSYWAADWIKQLAREGFSYGAYNCSPGNFCPDRAITRSEMASMLVRTFINFLP